MLIVTEMWTDQHSENVMLIWAIVSALTSELNVPKDDQLYYNFHFDMIQSDEIQTSFCCRPKSHGLESAARPINEPPALHSK